MVERVSIEPTPVGTAESSIPAGEEFDSLRAKFQTPEDVMRSYIELESKLGQNGVPPADPAAVTPPADPNAPPPAPTPNTPPGTPPPGDFLQPFRDEYANAGALTDASYDALAQRGFTRDVVDQYIAGQQALSAQQTSDVLSGVGGEEGWAQLSEWAGGNLPAAEVENFNRGLESNDPEIVKRTVESLAFRRTQAGGVAPGQQAAAAPVQLEGAVNAPAAVGFTSAAQVTAAMKDPRYHKDAAYTADVEQRLASSPENIYEL